MIYLIKWIKKIMNNISMRYVEFTYIKKFDI